MKLYMREHVFTWGDRFTVWDAQETEQYFVQGEVLTLGKKLHIYDPQGQEVAYIQQELMHWMPQYKVWIKDRGSFTVQRKFSWFRPRYVLPELDWTVEGDLWGHNYQAFRQGRTVLTVSKAWMTWGDSYELDILEPEHALAALATVVIIDCMVEQQSDD